MRTLQAHEAKARITAFLGKIKANQPATVIRHNRPSHSTVSRNHADMRATAAG